MTSFLLAISTGLLMSFAWWMPGTFAGALLGWASALGLAASTRTSQASYRSLYTMGLVWNSLGFFWLTNSMHDFGGFDIAACSALFVLFITISSIQNLVHFFIFRHLPEWTERLGVRLAISWSLSEFISIRIFPWHFGHTQLGILPLAQIADLGGALLITFLMCWVADVIWKSSSEKRYQLSYSAPLLLLGISYCYGSMRLAQFKEVSGRPLDVALVQANITITEKSDMKYFKQNTERYVQLTKQLARDKMLVIWPETVIQDWVYVDTGSVFADKRLPNFDADFHLLTGALTFKAQHEYYNSALAILADGRIPQPYHKQILMPFGEYMPFASVLPFLNNLDPNIGQFTAGTDTAIMNLPSFDEKDPAPIRIAPLICYEDVAPRLARQAVAEGAELLINLTNDAWFGKTIAPFQHHLIASFRAIENRRYLLRSTNSGLTAIVAPTGETTSQLPIFDEGTILARVHLLSYRTVYAHLLGDWPWWILTTVAGVLVMRSYLRSPDKRIK